jgi:fumarate hydratase subunit beta
MSMPVKLNTPLKEADVLRLTAGDLVLISGTIYTARDAAHKRLVDLISGGKPLPFDVEGAVIYFAGPSPARPGRPIGSVGPTTSGRMDIYSPLLIGKGLRGMIGKGTRSQEVVDAMIAHKAVYLAATGGAAALLARSVLASEVVAYEELGPEAVRKLTVRDFPAVVVNDCKGNDLYRQGVEKYAKKA